MGSGIDGCPFARKIVASMSVSSLTALSRGSESEASSRPVAVIDIGTTLIRMAIAEIDESGNVRTLERLSQAVSLGKDTFTVGVIQKSTIEECAKVLKSYRERLDEYRISADDQIRVVATSAVREAGNRLAFLDRIYIATGFQVEPIDEAEVNRITYLGVAPFLKTEPSLAAATTLVIEVGGGSTELLLVRDGDVVNSHSYRIGSLRLRETLETYRAPTAKARAIMESQILRAIEQVAQQVPGDETLRMIALGGDVRFATSQLEPRWDRNRLARLKVSALERFTDEVLRTSEDELVRKYHLPFSDAESLGPALLANVLFARTFKLKQILVSNVNLRDGLLQEMAAQGAWTEEFGNQIVRSALELGRKFEFNEPHAVHVAYLSKLLFNELQDEHLLPARFEVILYAAALLHEIGMFVGTTGYHKHSMYLISNSEMFGLGEKDLLLVALIARYHRRASPKPTHSGYSGLDRDGRVAVAKLSAILRVADALEHSHSQRVREIRCKREPGRFVITVPHTDDLSLEQLALKQKGSLFEETFGMTILLREAQS